MSSHLAYLVLGSNLGNRSTNLENAKTEISKLSTLIIEYNKIINSKKELNKLLVTELESIKEKLDIPFIHSRGFEINKDKTKWPRYSSLGSTLKEALRLEQLVQQSSAATMYHSNMKVLCPKQPL